MEILGIVYKVTNQLNQKSYVGQTRRIKQFKSYYGSGKLIKQAIAKNGKGNFTKEILFECFTQEELDEKEIKAIIEHKSYAPEGYNLAEGGQFGSGSSKLKYLSEEERQAHSEKMKNACNYKEKYTEKEYAEFCEKAKLRAIEINQRPETKLRKSKIMKKRHEDGLVIVDPEKRREAANRPGVKEKKSKSQKESWLRKTEEEKEIIRQKLSEAHKTEEYLEKYREFRKDFAHSDETKEKLRQANIGKHHSEETLKKLNNRKWVTNGKINLNLKKDETIPEGFYEGMTQKQDRVFKPRSKSWVNNGVEHKQIEKNELEYYLAMGWKNGMLRRVC